MSITHPQVHPAVDSAEVDRRMSFADAALGLAGQEINDEVLRELSHQVASGMITADEAIERGMAYISGH